MADEKQRAVVNEQNPTLHVDEDKQTTTMESENYTRVVEQIRQMKAVESDEQTTVTGEEMQMTVRDEVKQTTGSVQEENGAITMNVENKTITTADKKETTFMEEKMQMTTTDDEQQTIVMDNEHHSMHVNEEKETTTIEAVKAEEKHASDTGDTLVKDEVNQTKTEDKENQTISIDEETQRQTLNSGKEIETIAMDEEKRTSGMEEEKQMAVMEDEMQMGSMIKEKQTTDIEEEKQTVAVEEEKQRAVINDDYSVYVNVERQTVSADARKDKTEMGDGNETSPMNEENQAKPTDKINQKRVMNVKELSINIYDEIQMTGMDEKTPKKVGFCESRKCSVVLLALLVLAIGAAALIAAFATGVRGLTPPVLKWWQTTIIYEIYPRSFKDSDRDGTGDLQGIISKLDHFSYINVSAIWIAPFYRSPMIDFGYDTTNHTEVDPLFGNLEDFDELVKKAHEKEIKVIIDFVPGHTSDLHNWFQKSTKWTLPYRDYYVWSDGKTLSNGTKVPPNNWLSVFGQSAWEWNDVRNQYYYHAFTKNQPDLNYRSPAVQEEMKKVLRFWLDRGVDGVRVDAVAYLVESADLAKDDPPSNKTGVETFEFNYLEHIYTLNQPEVKYIIRGWRDVLDEYEDRFMIVEVYDPPEKRNVYYDYGADMPFNFDLVNAINQSGICGGLCLRDRIEKEYDTLPEDAWPNFVLGNHDNKRIASERKPKFVSAFNMLLLTLKGTPITYYGEEIGMLDINLTWDQTKDPWGLQYGKNRYQEVSRDPERSPMQWTEDRAAGFSNGSSTWLPVHPLYQSMNVEEEKNSTSSPLEVYRTLSILRNEAVFTFANVSFAVVNENILSYIRHAATFGKYLIAINFGDSTSSNVDYSKKPVDAEKGIVVVNTGNFKNDKYAINSTISLNAITLEPSQGLVLRL